MDRPLFDAHAPVLRFTSPETVRDTGTLVVFERQSLSE